MHTPEGQLRERDLVLPANEYALILDQTKGHISVHTGPTKQSLSQTDQPVVYDEQTRRFRSCELGKSVQPFCLAQQGAYVQLENPSSEEKNEHPPVGSSPSTPKLNHGQKVNIPGPVSFALWPGQSARVIQGHTLASNQYLLVRVYDDNAARENLETAVLKTVEGDGEKSQQQKKELIKAEELAIGKLIVIKGTEVNFFIPPTGLEVIPEANGQYVREAVSLERLEYCLLLDQNGNKRYVRGPAVVFPSPTEEFVTEDGIRKFRAVELGPNSGIHIKVIASYKEEDKNYQAGDELFITGKQTRIYFPREEHAIIRQNNQQIHHGVTLPRGEARYVLDKDKGIIELIKGPCIFLPDPRKQIIVKRVLTDSQCGLMYPGNEQALHYNRSLQRIRQAHAVMVANAVAEDRTRGYTKSATRGRIGSSGNIPDVYSVQSMDAAPAAAAFAGSDVVVGDIFDQNLEYDQPQSITIDNKYDGAVTISPWTGYAIMVKNKAGDREVVMGPSTRILEYDEELEVLALSTGKPKSDSRLLKTVYLQVENNKVSDFIEVETSDFTKAKIVVSFRVNFIGDSGKWFNVANYTKLLCEHMRSKIRRAVMQHDVEHFYRNAADIVRDTVLGKSDKDSKRGFTFSENNMHIYDVEVLEVELLDRTIQQLLADVQREGIDHALQRARLKREVEASSLIEQTKREKQSILAGTEAQKIQLQMTAIDDSRALEKSRFIANSEARVNAKEIAQADRAIHEIKLSQEALTLQQKLQFADAEQKMRVEQLNAEADATVKKANAVSPHLIKALQGFGDRVTIERLAHAVSPFGMIDLIRGKSIAETFGRLLRGSSLEDTASYIEDINDQAV